MYMKTPRGWWKASYIIAGLFLLPAFAAAQLYTIDQLSPVPALPDDLGLAPPGITPPYIPGVGLEVDGISRGHNPDELLDQRIRNLEFSVDRPSLGLPGTAVNMEASLQPPQAAGDIFQSSSYNALRVPGGNLLLHDFDGVTLTPQLSFPLDSLNPEVVAGAPVVDTDGWENDFVAEGLPLFFSYDAASVANLGFSGADVFWNNLVPGYDLPVPLVYGFANQFGLSAADELDALVVFDTDMVWGSAPTDRILFSLDRNSPTLLAMGWSPADVLLAMPGAPVSLFATGDSLGLNSQEDNLNALDYNLVPEPSEVAGLSLLLMLGYLLARRRQ